MKLRNQILGLGLAGVLAAVLVGGTGLLNANSMAGALEDAANTSLALQASQEADLIHDEFGGFIWEVTRPGAQTCVGHVSESGLSRNRIDRTLVNAGTLDEFREVVQAAAASIANATMKDIKRGSESDRRTQGCAG